MKKFNETFISLAPGVLYCIAIACLTFIVWGLFKPISSLMWAFIFSILVGNTLKIPRAINQGVAFCSGRFLRGVIASLGIVTSATIWLRVGIGLLNVLVVIFFSLLFGIWFGEKMGLSKRLSTLIGVGTSICGASAIAATATAIGAKEEEIGLSLAGITLFGLASMFLYPLLFVNTFVGPWLNESLNAYAIWVGSGVHETAQVVAAAGALGEGVIGPALSVKSVRIFMIGPVMILATFLFNKSSGDVSGIKRSKLVVPMFGVAFIVNSFLSAILDAYSPHLGFVELHWLSIKGALSGTLFPFLLSIAFAGVGSKVNFRSIARLGLRPFAVSAIMAVSAGLLAFILAALVAPLVS